MNLVSQLKTGKDAWKISLPSQMLTPESMLEYMSYFAAPNECILGYVMIKCRSEKRWLDEF